MKSSEPDVFTHLHSGSWSGRGDGKNQTALEALARKRKASSQMRSTMALLPSWFLQGLGRGGEHGGHSWTLQGRGQGSGGKGRGWLSMNPLTLEDLARGGARERDAADFQGDGKLQMGRTPNQETAGITQANPETLEAWEEPHEHSKENWWARGPS